MKYQAEDEEAKDIENLNKIIENNLKLEIKKNNNIINIENIIKKNDWELLDDFTCHFNQNIERIWQIIKSLDRIFIPNNEICPVIIYTNSNIWNKGNIFGGKLFNLYEFIAKVIKLQMDSELKKIEWLLDLGNDNNVRLKINLYKVTEDNSTVLNIKLKYMSSMTLGENTILKIKEKFKENNYINNIRIIFEKNYECLYQYESGIIPGKMDEIWNILTDYSKLISISPNNDIFIPLNIKNLKVGQISKIPIRIKNIEENVEIKFDLYEENSVWNKWRYGYSILGGSPFEVLKQSLLVQLIKINKNEAQLSIFTQIHGNATKQMMKNLSEKKLYVISSFQDYFENFKL